MSDQGEGVPLDIPFTLRFARGIRDDDACLGGFHSTFPSILRFAQSRRPSTISLS
jgi:hypothetical protein